MSEQDRKKQRKQDWKEVEEYEWKKKFELFKRFGFDIRIYWHKKVTKEMIKKRRRRLKIIENILKAILISFIIWFIIFITWYIVSLYSTIKGLYH